MPLVQGLPSRCLLLVRAHPAGPPWTLAMYGVVPFFAFQKPSNAAAKHLNRLRFC
jgi:hypothetical protein